MANTSQIRQLQTPDHNIDVYPLTLEDAVFDEDGVQLSTKIENLLNLNDCLSIVNGKLCITYTTEV